MIQLDKRRARTRLTAATLAFTLVGGLAVADGLAQPTPASAESHSPGTPKDYYPDTSSLAPGLSLSGANPCTSLFEPDGTMTSDNQERFDERNCTVTPIGKFGMPASLIPEQKISDLNRNCYPVPIPASTGTSNVFYATQASTSTLAHSHSVSVGASYTYTSWAAPGGAGGSKAYTASIETTNGVTLSEAETNAIETGHWTNASMDLPIAPFSWHYMGFKDMYTQADLLWQWTPNSSVPNDVRSAVTTINIHEFRGNGPKVTTDPKYGVFGAPVPHSIPMTPAEIKKCWDDAHLSTWKPGDPFLEYDPISSNLALPTIDTPMMRAPQGVLELDAYPFIYSSSPIGNPITRNVAVGVRDVYDRNQAMSRAPFTLTQNDVPMWSWKAGYADLQTVSVKKALVMPPTSEVGLWTGNSCTSLTATVGGTGATNRDFEMRVEVRAVKMVNGVAKYGRTLADIAAPNPGKNPANRAEGKLDVTIPPDTEAIAIRTYRPDGQTQDMAGRWIFDGSRDAVVLAHPKLDCVEQNVPAGDQYLSSSYIGEVTKVTANLAATPEQVKADPYLNMRPNWAPATGQACDLGRPDYIGYACSGSKTTVDGKVYAAALGLHADTTIEWGLTSPTCNAVTFGYAWDDAMIRYEEKIGKQIRNNVKIVISVDGVATQTLALTRQPANHLYQATQTLKKGPHMIKLEVFVPGGDTTAAHVNIVEPKLSCEVQGPEIGTKRADAQTAQFDYKDVSSLTWSNEIAWHVKAARNINPSTNGRLETNGVVYPRGIGVHSVSSIDVKIPKQGCRVFASDVAVLDSGYDGHHTTGTVRFEVWSKGERIAGTDTVRYNETPTLVQADITGLDVITLKVYEVDHIGWDHAMWGSPVIGCAPKESVAPPTTPPPPGPSPSPSPSTPPLVALGTISAAKVQWAENRHSYREATRGLNVDTGKPATLNGRTFDTAIAGVSRGQVAIRTGGECVKFSATVGVDDYAASRGQGSLRFELLSNEVLIAKSPNMIGNGTTYEFTDVNISGVEYLVLRINDVNSNIDWDHGVWGNPTLTCVKDSEILSSEPQGSVRFIADLPWKSTSFSSSHWPQKRKDIYGVGPVKIEGEDYKNGIGAHSTSGIRVDIGGNCSVFEAAIGIDDTAGNNGSVKYQVWGDQTMLYESPLIGGSMSKVDISVNVAGRSELTLTVIPVDNENWDHASWGDPRVKCVE